LALLNPEIAEGKISVKAITPEVIKNLLADTVPVKKAIKAQKLAKVQKQGTKAIGKGDKVGKEKLKAEKESRKFAFKEATLSTTGITTTMWYERP
jgi:bla regulator protein BlaR1